MFGIIYKITCKENGKVYIGQTIRPMQERFERHIKEALKNEHTALHLQRAIRKYGPKAFYIEKIDEAESQQELNEKEKHYIALCNSIENGYNIAVGGEGGNTYAGKTDEEMANIRKKIGAKNFGRNNGVSHQIKCKSIVSNKELFFDSLSQCLSYFGIKNKGIVMDRVNGKNKTLWHREWLFAKENSEYQNFVDDAFSRSRSRGASVTLSKNNEAKTFPSKNLALKFLGLPKGALINGAIINGWTISF